MTKEQILLLIEKEIETAKDDFEIAQAYRRASEQIYFAGKQAILVDLLEKIKKGSE